MWTAIGTIAALLLAIFAWWVKVSDNSGKKKADEDAKIDACSDADDIMRESGKLRK